MARPHTGAERYFAEQKKDPEFQAAYEEAARRIAAVDELVRSIEKRRVARGLSKAELARRAGMLPEAVRRLFSTSSPNPTAATLVALADALDLELVTRPAGLASMNKSAAAKTVAAKKTGGPSVQSIVRRRKNSSR